MISDTDSHQIQILSNPHPRLDFTFFIPEGAPPMHAEKSYGGTLMLTVAEWRALGNEALIVASQFEDKGEDFRP